MRKLVGDFKCRTKSMRDPGFRPQRLMIECRSCFALIPMCAARCAFCGYRAPLWAGWVEIRQQSKAVAAFVRRFRQGAALLFGSVAGLSGGAVASHLADVAASAKPNPLFLVITSAAFIISLLLAIMAKPDAEELDTQ